MRAVNVLVAGFTAPETQRLSDALLAAGYRVMGAEGRQGARMFVQAASPDVVLIPSGPERDRVLAWFADLDQPLLFADVPVGASAEVLARRVQQAEAQALDGPLHTRPSERPDFPDSAPTFAPPAPVAAPAPPTAPTSPSTARARRPVHPPTPDPDEVREVHPELVSKLAQVRFGDYHSILEVEPGGSPYAAREAFERLSRRFSARGWPHRLQPEEIDMLDEIGRGLSDAHVVLGEPELRARYERALAGAALSGAGRT